MKRRGDISPSVITFVLGAVLVVLMVIGVIYLLVSVGSGSEDAKNKEAFRKFINLAAESVSNQEVGGSATSTNWELSSSGKYTHYAIGFVTPAMANLFLDENIRATSSFSKYFDKTSEYFIDKCRAPGDMCYCLFKIKYKVGLQDCGGLDQNAILMKQLGNYQDMLSAMNQWGAPRIVGLSASVIENAQVLNCVSMKKEAHCVYTNSSGTTGPCIIHSTVGDGTFKPILWMRASGGTSIKGDVIKFDAVPFAGGVAPSLSFEDTGGIVATLSKYLSYSVVDVVEATPTFEAADMIYKLRCIPEVNDAFEQAVQNQFGDLGSSFI